MLIVRGGKGRHFDAGQAPCNPLMANVIGIVANIPAATPTAKPRNRLLRVIPARWSNHGAFAKGKPPTTEAIGGQIFIRCVHLVAIATAATVTTATTAAVATTTSAATATITTTAAATTATIPTTATATTTTAAATLFLRTSFIDGQSATAMLQTIHRSHRSLGFLIGVHFDETETLAPT